MAYVDSRRLEITCGEAPYLVSRYDTSTGMPIEIHKRIGILDRKIRVINENTVDEKEWMEWIIRAFQSVYGYEYHQMSLFEPVEEIEENENESEVLCSIYDWRKGKPVLYIELGKGR